MKTNLIISALSCCVLSNTLFPEFTPQQPHSVQLNHAQPQLRCQGCVLALVARLKVTLRLLAHSQLFVLVLTGSSVTRSRLQASSCHLQIQRPLHTLKFPAYLPSEGKFLILNPLQLQIQLRWALKLTALRVFLFQESNHLLQILAARLLQ